MGLISTEQITAFFTSYAYAPNMVYGGVFLFMTLSSFGLPIPEEVVLVSCGIISYMAMNPDLYPPPTGAGPGVDYQLLAFLCFIAVLYSDLLVFLVGKYFGAKIFKTRFFKKHFSEDRMLKVNAWYGKWGALVCGIFRFTPGLRFPGHMSCGMMGVPVYKFMLVDGLAALLTVPTQVILVALYGEVILAKFKEFKLVLGGLFLLWLVYYLSKKYFFKKKGTIESG
jgi:membrane protein DedA with SNARE-associated domain